VLPPNGAEELGLIGEWEIIDNTRFEISAMTPAEVEEWYLNEIVISETEIQYRGLTCKVASYKVESVDPRSISQRDIPLYLHEAGYSIDNARLITAHCSNYDSPPLSNWPMLQISKFKIVSWWDGVIFIFRKVMQH
jgi:hypothetical protein